MKASTFKLSTRSRSAKPFQLPRFYPILDTGAIQLRGGDIVAIADAFLDAGVRILQFRHKRDWTQPEYGQAQTIANLCTSAHAVFIMNDRADFAHLLGAGVHLGQEDLPVAAARKITGASAIVGKSTHNRRQFEWADEEAVNYLAIGPIFTTSSKENPDPVLGLEKLKAIRPFSSKPVVAIGGVTLENAPQIFEAGANSVAVISGCLTDSCEPASLKALCRQWLQL